MVGQFDNTPKAFANFSPGLEAKQEPWGTIRKKDGTLKGFGCWRTLSGLDHFNVLVPGLSLTLQPWAESSERLRRYFKRTTTRYSNAPLPVIQTAPLTQVLKQLTFNRQ